MSINVAGLRTFVAVAEAGNIIDAAQSLGRSPSAISMSLKQLEEHLGRPLFEGDRKSQLTVVGNFVLDRARREVDHFEQTIGSIESYARNEIGRISVACVPTIATLVLPDLVHGFLDRFPNIELDIQDMDAQSILKAVENGPVEVGVASVREARAGLSAVPLFADPFGLICKSDHPLTKLDRAVAWSDLDEYRFIANGLCRFVTAPGIRPVLARSTMMVHSAASLMALVAAGVGVSIAGQFSIPADSKDLRFLPIAGVTDFRPIHVVTRANSVLSPAVDAFIEALRTSVAERGWGHNEAAAE